jgi:para-nitrobenzyl esterase
VFAYEFTWKSPVLDGVLGSCHALEIPFVFGNLQQPGVRDFVGTDAGGEAIRRRLETTMRQAWGAFVRDGVPSSPSLPSWPAYDTAERSVMMLGDSSGVASDPHGDRLSQWDEWRGEVSNVFRDDDRQ